MMPDKTLKQIDVLRHELKALRYILDNFHAGKLPPAVLPPREDFLSAQAREIYDIILKAPGREAAEARIAEIRLDDVDVASFLRLRGAARGPAQNRGGLNALAAKELHLLLDSAGALIVYQEEGTHWAGVLGFSSEERAREFVAASHLDAAETAAIDPADPAQVASLVNAVKQRAVRYLLLDLDWRSGECVQVEFEGNSFGASRERQFTPHQHQH